MSVRSQSSRSDGPDPSFRVCIRDGSPGWDADDVGAFGGEHVVESAGELAGAVADHEPDVSFVVHHEVAGGLGRPGAGRVRGDAGEVDAAGVELDEEQHVEPPQQDGVDGEEVTGEDPGCLGAQEVVQVSAVRPGDGSRPSVLRIDQTVDAPIVMPRRASSPWMRR